MHSLCRKQDCRGHTLADGSQPPKCDFETMTSARRRQPSPLFFHCAARICAAARGEGGRILTLMCRRGGTSQRSQPREAHARKPKCCFMRCSNMTIVAVTVVQLLREFAARTSLRGGNPYRAKAYARAADSLAALVVPLDQIIAEGRLTEIPGIGDAIADIVTKLHRTGRIPALKRCARKSRPASLRCSPYRACGRTRSSSFTKSWGSSPSQDWSRPRARTASSP
jgi:hypothetical protein